MKKLVCYLIKVYSKKDDTLVRAHFVYNKRDLRKYLNKNVDHTCETAFVKKC